MIEAWRFHGELKAFLRCGVVGSLTSTSARYSITFPFTVLLKALVIKAVRGKLRLRTYNNIFLACLAMTDVLTGLFRQPSYVLWRIFLMFGLRSSDMIENFHLHIMTTFLNASCMKVINRYSRCHGFKSRTGFNFFQALFSLLLKWCSLLQRSFSYSFFNPQFTYMIFICSQR